jgi:uncharacterized protein YndB with AHSA1/START domain
VYGTLEQTDAGPRLRFARRLPHPPEKVWRALTEPEHLKAWFPDTIVVEDWTPGAPLRFQHPGFSFDGEVLAVEEGALLEFSWGPDVLRFELQPDGDGTLLVLIDTLETVGKAARDGAGWHVCLDALEHDLNGTAADGGTSERWREVHGTYVEQFGPEAAQIGPPEGALD